MKIRKVLIIRFSSIGDIVLTTPVIRCMKEQLGTEIHFVTKTAFRFVLSENPYLDRLHTFEKNISDVYDALKAEKFDLVIDLHLNIRSLRLKWKLGVKSYAFDKINFRKWLAVNFKMRSVLPDKHIVQRYLETVAHMGVRDDGKGLDYFIPVSERISISERFGIRGNYIALVVGGSYNTKKIPLNKLVEICRNVALPVILLGGKDDISVAASVEKEVPGVINACGTLSFDQSASVVEQAAWVITSDTGLMHVAAAFHKKIISVWGNTVPEFGMPPYQPDPENKILQVNGLGCRPCSKLGYAKCPLGHFRCMNDISYDFVKELR